MNRKMVMYDTELYFLDDAGVLMEVTATVDDDDFFVLLPQNAKPARAGSWMNPEEIEGIKAKLK